MYVRKYRVETISSSCFMDEYDASWAIEVSEISEEDIKEIMKVVDPILEREKKLDWKGEQELIKKFHDDPLKT